jgi:beta-N-acetylhexosaminidase
MARGRLALAGLVRPRLALTGLVRPRLELADLVRPRLALAVIAVAVAGCAGGAPTPEVPARAPEPAPAEAPAIVDRPISFSEERIEMTREYIRGHYGFDPDEIAFTPRMIVLHWTAIEDLEATFRTFDPETLGGRPDLSGAGAVNVSSQFVVAKDGTIYRLMPENWMARHVIGLNWGAIGVENVGSGTRESSTLTDDQAAANIALVRYLVRKYPTIEYLIGHHEYRAFEGHPLWLERDPDYRTDKIDPGDAFMAAVRAGVEDLGLLGPP